MRTHQKVEPECWTKAQNWKSSWRASQLPHFFLKAIDGTENRVGQSSDSLQICSKKKKIKEIKENSQTVGGHVCKPVLTVLVLIIQNQRLRKANTHANANAAERPPLDQHWLKCFQRISVKF